MPFKDPEKRRAYERKYWRKNRDKANAKNAAWMSTESGKASKLASCKAFRERNKLKVKAWKAVEYAMQTGKLPPLDVCNQCDQPAKHYHHADYSKPLEVEALCVKCHASMHHTDI